MPAALLSVSLTPVTAYITLTEIQATTLDYELAPGASVDSIVYSSSNAAVATVDLAGDVYAVALGVCTITVEVTASGPGLDTTTLSDSITIYVVDPEAGPPGLPRSRTALPVVVVQLTIDGVTQHFSDIEYGDPDERGVGTNWHDARVVGDIAYSRGGGCVLWGEDRGAAGGLGNIELINVDGALDALITDALIDGRVDVFVVDQDAPMSQAEQIASAVVTAIEARGEQTVRIVTGDILARLDTPLQTALYSGSDVPESLIDRPKPVAIGNPLSCPIVLVDDVDYHYDCHDSDQFDVSVVRDNGIELTEAPSSEGWRISTSPGVHGIELLQQPVGRIVADISATAGTVEAIIGAAEGDFDTDIADWTTSTDTVGSDSTASASLDAGGFALLEAASTAAGEYGIARMLFPATLASGQRFDWSMAIDVTGSGLFLFSVTFVPDSLNPAHYITCYSTSAAHAGTISGTFTAPADGKLRITAAAQDAAASITAEVDTVRIDRVAAGGDVADIIEMLLARAGIGVDQIDSDSLDSLRTNRPWACSYWADSADTIRNVLDQVLASVYGWIYTTPTGAIAVGYLTPPEAGDASVAEITETELAGEVEVEPDHAPGLSTTVAGARNWYRYAPSELADAIPDADRPILTADYRIRKQSTNPVGIELGNRAGAAVSSRSESGIATLLDDAADIQAAADYLADLYPEGLPRRFYKIPVFLSSASTRRPGNKITLRYNRLGCAAGRDLRLVRIEGRAGDDLCILRCWGSAIDEVSS